MTDQPKGREWTPREYQKYVRDMAGSACARNPQLTPQEAIQNLRRLFVDLRGNQEYDQLTAESLILAATALLDVEAVRRTRGADWRQN